MSNKAREYAWEIAYKKGGNYALFVALYDTSGVVSALLSGKDRLEIASGLTGACRDRTHKGRRENPAAFRGTTPSC